MVVDFHAEWCKPCKMLTPVVDELARKAGGKVVFLKVDVDEARDLSAAQGVKSMPTLIFFRNGKCVDTIVGADVPGLREKVARALANPLIGSLKDMCSSPALLIPSLLAYLALPRLLPLLRPVAHLQRTWCSGLVAGMQRACSVRAVYMLHPLAPLG